MTASVQVPAAHLALHALFQLGKHAKAVDGRDACALDHTCQSIRSPASAQQVNVDQPSGSGSLLTNLDRFSSACVLDHTCQTVASTAPAQPLNINPPSGSGTITDQFSSFHPGHDHLQALMPEQITG